MLWKEGGELGAGDCRQSEFIVTLIIMADVSGDEMAGAFSQLLRVHQLSLPTTSSQVGKVTGFMLLSLPYQLHPVIREGKQ